MEEAWRRIVAWYKANTAPGTLRLPPGATEAAIRSAEKEVGMSLPSDLRAFYRLHDGLGGKWLLHYGEFNTLAQLVSAWRGHRGFEQRSRVPGGGPPVELRGPIRPVWWNCRRVLITNIGGTDGVMVDLDPAQGGTVGQFLEFSHEIGPWCVLAPSFSVWLDRIAAGLEAGKWQYDGYEVYPKGWCQQGGNLGDWEARLAEPNVTPDPEGT